MTDGQVYKTLCINCTRAGGCTAPCDWDEPILSCSLFESLDDFKQSGLTKTMQPDPGRMEGLCVDCGNRNSCVYLQSEGGTWHCEEYC